MKRYLDKIARIIIRFLPEKTKKEYIYTGNNASAEGFRGKNRLKPVEPVEPVESEAARPS